ncbi:MFS general substrate transporter [Decorospora gaudefroyi]|uniref:MFS general substrate transporter n=1 Tax=Decorospora gaudefroyi TaxID=184978 RepID=A0A6A5JWF6_9PLEO|nr:MFS general substrate transporter [Decorospora gaudefroyi]
MFLVFRFFAGMGSFWLLGAVPVWMTEIVPPRNRGLLVDIHSAALLFGYASASWCGFGFYHIKTINAWRGPLALQCLPALIVIAFMKWLPESPRWLIQKGRHEQARKVLSKLHAPEEAALEFTQIKSQLQLDSALPNTWKSLITKPSYRKRALFAVGLACGIQFTGVLVTVGASTVSEEQNLTSVDYGAIIYGGLGFKEDVILLFSAGFNTLAWVCGIGAMFIIDLFPRNVLVAFGTALVTSCLTVEAALVANFPPGPDQNNAALRAAVAMTFCYIAFAQLFLDGTQYVYYAELFPNYLRAKGMTTGMASISLMNVM